MHPHTIRRVRRAPRVPTRPLSSAAREHIARCAAWASHARRAVTDDYRRLAAERARLHWVAALRARRRQCSPQPGGAA